MARWNPLAIAALSFIAFAVQGCPKKDEPTGGGTPAPTIAPAPTTPTGGAAGGTAATTAQPTVAPSGPPGTIAGTVKFTGKAPEMKDITPKPTDPVCLKPTPPKDNSVLTKDGGLQDVLVRITPGGAKGDARGSGPTLKQQGCMYRPRVAGVMTGQEVTYENDDKTMHNVQVLKGSETLFNTGQPAGSPAIKKPAPEETSVNKVKCAVHPWMTAFLIVSDHPYFTVSAPDGKFELKDVPSGTYKLEAWHSEYGVKTADITVAPGKSVDPNFVYSGTEKPAE